MYRKISFPFQNHQIIGDINCSEREKTSTIMLHGGGLATTRHRFKKLRDLLKLQNESSLAFDFIGHGETGGDLARSSLHERFDTVANILSSGLFNEQLTVIGSSMSGYTAIKITEQFKVDNLVLFVPAVYHKDAFSLCFDSGFTELIRSNNSWVQTDAFEILEKFKGKLLIVSADNDQVVPNEITNKIYDAGKNAKSNKMIMLNNSNHSIFDYLENNGLNQDIANEILSMVKDKKT